MKARRPGVVGGTPPIESDGAHARMAVKRVVQRQIKVVDAIPGGDVMWVTGAPGNAEAGQHRGRHPDGFGACATSGTTRDVGSLGKHEVDPPQELPLHGSVAIDVPV